jgi:phospholipid/cholesterol/gamma-HCH transport system substrate-binding protein
MDGNRRLSLVVGAFALAAVGALDLTILSLSSQQGIFRNRYRLVAHYENVRGLLPNAPVWLAGTQVGRVETVSFGSYEGKPAVEVVLQIDRDVQDRIRADSVASIGTVGLLGDTIVEISLGTEEAPVLKGGSEVRAQTPLDINRVIDRGGVALDEFATLAESLNKVVEGFESAGGGRELGKAVGAFSDIVGQVQDGEGLLHSLIYDHYEGGGVKSIERSLGILEGILDEVANGEGILHTLIYTRPTEQDLVIEALEAGARLNSILAKIDRGEGTIGLLLNDPTLYEDLKLLVGGARRSAVVRTMVRLSTDSGDE